MERHYAFNNFGARDDVNYTMARTPGRPRLTVLGDSFANGQGVPDVAARFANRLRAAHPDWEVQLLAVDGQDTGMLLRRLSAMLERGYEIDAVLYAYCLNDLSDLVADWGASLPGRGGVSPS